MTEKSKDDLKAHCDEVLRRQKAQYMKEYRAMNKEQIKKYYEQTSDCDVCGRKGLGMYYLEKHKKTKYCQKVKGNNSPKVKNSLSTVSD